MSASSTETERSRHSVAEVFAAFLKLGCVSFGGPIAHLGYFNDEFVKRRGWLHADAYAEAVALCQFLPGPASSQVGMVIGLSRAGVPGALAAWLGFTLPSAVLMILCAYGLGVLGESTAAPWVHGLKIAAVAVVAQALVGMARSLCPDRPRAILAIASAVAVFMVPTVLGQIGVIVAGGLGGWIILKAKPGEGGGLPIRLSIRTAYAALAVFAGLLVGLPFLADDGHVLAELADGLYRTGALVFGGGHVVLPLMQAEVVPRGWMSDSVFLAGYGAAQALPGPLFAFAGYVGTNVEGLGVGGGLLALVAIFLPSLLLLLGVLPFWALMRQHAAMQSVVAGINAAVVGLLAAALLGPVGGGAILGVADLLIALVLFALLMLKRAPSWLIVGLGAVASAVVAALI